MNLELIDPFIKSASNVLTTMGSMEATHSDPVVCKELPPTDVTGILNMVSDSVEGVLAVSFTKPVIFELTKRLIGISPTDIDEDVKSLVGDITNMVYGGAKTILDDEGYNFDMSIPTVIQELDINIDFYKNSSVVVTTFETEVGKFYIQISFEG